MKRATFNILFYVKRTKLLKNGDAPVYLRITLNGDTAEISLKRCIKPTLWDTNRNKAKGTNPEAAELNDYITSVRGQLFMYQRELHGFISFSHRWLKAVFLFLNYWYRFEDF